MTYGKWIWAILFILVIAYTFNIMGFKDKVKSWF